MQTALVIGGSGPTGHFIVNGLRARGYKVTILHRGHHEVAEIPGDVEHIHVDPHFRDTLLSGIENRTFDLTIASYGRTQLTAEIMVGRTGRFISASGITYRAVTNPALGVPQGGGMPCREDDAQPDKIENPFVFKICETERAVLRLHPNATIFRYPYVYGAYQVLPREWSIIRRFRDGRKFLILPEGGMTYAMHGYAGNVAAAVLAAVDNPEISAGQIYNCGDDRQYTLRQTAEIIADELEWDVEILSVPYSVAGATRCHLMKGRIDHRLYDTTKLRTELGYRDIVPPKQAIAQTARWYMENPPDKGGEIERALADPFDYAAEDRTADIIRRAMKDLAQAGDGDFERPHPYAYPRT